MKKSKNVPEIRFEGFTEDWELRKFPEFVEFYNGQTYTPADVQESGTLVLRSSNVKNGEVVDADNVYINSEKVSVKNVKDGDIIVVVRNGSRALIGKHAEVKGNMPNTIIGAFMTGIRSEHYSFVNALLGTYQFVKEIEKNMGATINQITGYMFSKMEFMIPGDDEQEAIGKYFKELDHLITLHQRKRDKLLDLKNSMLYKLFPKEGDNKPELRFQGFTDDWSKKKLGDCFSERTESFPDGELLSVTINDGIKKFSELNRNDNSNENKSKYKKVYVGDIAYNSMRMWQGASGYSPYEGIVSPAYTVLQPNEGIDSKCFSYLFKRPDIVHMFQLYSKGITSDTWNLKYPEFKELEIYVSEDYEEQKLIGQYLSKLDSIIDLNNEKLKKLEHIKSYLLDKMFV